MVLRGCAGSVRVACFSIVRNECAVANQSQTTNGSMQCASQCDDGWQICTNRQYVPMGACLLVVFGRCARWLFNGCPAAVQRAQRLSGASGASGVRVGHAGESWPELVVLRRSSDGARVASHLILAIRWRETSHDFDFWRLFSSRATPNTPLSAVFARKMPVRGYFTRLNVARHVFGPKSEVVRQKDVKRRRKNAGIAIIRQSRRLWQSRSWQRRYPQMYDAST